MRAMTHDRLMKYTHYLKVCISHSELVKYALAFDLRCENVMENEIIIMQ